MSGKITGEIQNGRPLASVEVELLLNVYRTAEQLQRLQRRMLAPEGLDPEGYNVLRILRGAGAAGHPRSVVQQRMVTGADRLLTIAHGLKQLGLVDGSIHLTITRAGVEAVARVERPLDEAFRAQFAAIPPADVRVAIAVLEQVRAGIEPQARG